MRSRLLKKLLECNYIVADFGDYVGIGSSLCHDLIRLNKSDMSISYALDYRHRGRVGLGRGDEKIAAIWDKLQALIDSGEINDIINGVDEIESPIPVFYAKDGVIVEAHTDEFGWPNTTHDGVLMYDNTFFKTKEKAVWRGIDDASAGVSIITDRISETRQELAKWEQRLRAYQEELNSYLKIKKQIEKEQPDAPRATREEDTLV